MLQFYTNFIIVRIKNDNRLKQANRTIFAKTIAKL